MRPTGLPGTADARRSAGRVLGQRQQGRAPCGVWGVGRIAAPPEPGAPGEAWTAPLDLTILDEPLRVRREVLRADPRLAGAEVLRQPQAANPSYLTVAQFEALRAYLPRDGGT
ncbi:hypothetical protein AB0893_05080 [Micromonospora aurantiaca]|uniref:hypothetical protein n=1 Tax=Micromonospora aurantiaca (nom. illeg.) TaxID=47850 RepID=UPI003453DBC3